MAKRTPWLVTEALRRPLGRRRLLRGSALAGAGAALGLLPPGRAALAAPARQDAETALRVFEANPLNAGTPLEQLSGLLTPNHLFFVRNHFAIPTIQSSDWTLTVDGAVAQPLTLGFDDLRHLPSRSQLTLVECAGNARSGFTPRAEGTQWDTSAVGVAEWTGVPVAAVLERAGLRPDAVEVVFHGGDNPGFQRSLTRDHVMDPDVILAYTMNGEPLPLEHGFPVRLLVPGWVGVASVKWLTRLQAVTEPYEGFYQRARYVIERENQQGEPQPVTFLPVRATIARPMANASLDPGPVVISGFAYSGQGRIATVEVSADAGATWQPATLAPPNEPGSWVRWQFLWTAAPGGYTLLARATDEAGNRQPSQMEWNRFGYGYNAPWPVPVTVG
ncbi:MAG TPA: sulfite oxidase [Chloroflexota bacterium]|nr:sulfite oxidase [Chloroflexota bacterium]